MGRTEPGYIISFDLGPYFHRELTENVKKYPYFAISVDEGLNESFQDCQMEMNIRI